MHEMKIPRIIHYCWFGRNEKPASVEYCINTWKQILPDYEIMEWNEDNFSIDQAPAYVQEAYCSKKWAFVSDYARLVALYNFGGFYFDTDVEVFRPFDELLHHHAVFGFEVKDYVMTAVMGAQKNASIIQDFLREYSNRRFILEDGNLNTDMTSVKILTKMLKKKGLRLNGKLQTVEDAVIVPQQYFSPNDFRNIFIKYKRENYCYHHCFASWYKADDTSGYLARLRHYLLCKAQNAIGTTNLYRLRHPGYADPMADESCERERYA